MSSYNSELPVLDTYRAVVSAFSDFLTVAIHTILFERDIYPKNSFLRARKYNYPVRQSRHPKVCQWIQDAVAAVEVEMFKVKDFSGSCCIRVSCHFDRIMLLMFLDCFNFYSPFESCVDFSYLGNCLFWLHLFVCARTALFAPYKLLILISTTPLNLVLQLQIK